MRIDAAMLKESMKVKLVDWLCSYITSHYELDSLIRLIDRYPEDFPGTKTSSSLHARLTSLIDEISKQPKELLRLLNSVVKRYDIDAYDFEELSHILIGTGLDVDIDREIVVFTGHQMAVKQHFDENVENLLDRLPSQANEFIKDAKNQLEKMEFKTCLARCRDALESLRPPSFIRYIKELEGNGKIQPVDRSLMEKVYGYLSSLGAHPANPDKEQALLGYNITVEILIFMLRKGLF